VLDDVGYLDGIATRSAERGRGYASATTAALCAAAMRAHVTRTFLLADPKAPAVVRMYERLGFRRAGLIASTKAPVT
jgi:predicted GNAT family acetyltransferase